VPDTLIASPPWPRGGGSTPATQNSQLAPARLHAQRYPASTMDVVQHYWASATTQSLLLLSAALALAYATVPVRWLLQGHTLSLLPDLPYSAVR
jgi:hypothetical protein